MSTERPLDGIGSIKAKLALLVTASIVAAALVSEIGDRAGVPVGLTVPVTIVAALGVTQWLARGMTSPLREMTSAAAAMATGDYSRRVTATSDDEVGDLGRAFNTMAADLASADQQRRQLIATVSHELRTPLAAQQALLENLVDGVVRADDEVLRTALAQAERLGSLVGDLLDLSRVDGGPASLALTQVQVLDLVRAAVAETGVSPRSVRHEVCVDPADLVVTADAARLAQLLANLIDNADRHSPSGATVTVSAGICGVDRWWLEVRDEGPGIAPELADRVFEPFGSDERAGGGTGLGLAIASWVCELHGGSITAVRSSPDQLGARLRAVLPREPVPGPNWTDGSNTGADAVRKTTSTVTAPQEEPTMTNPTAPPAPLSPHATVVLAPQPRQAPLVDSVFGDLWPESGLAPQVGLLLGSVGVGVLAAVILPFRDLGLALLIVLLVGGGLVLRASVRRREPWTLVTAAVCLGLLSLITLRAAEWVTVLAVLAGIALTTTALTGARGLVPFAGSLLAWPLAALRGLPLLGRTGSATSRVGALWPALRTAAISLVALVAFGGLFASADAVFGSWVSQLVPDFAWDSLTVRSFVGFVVGGSLLALCYLAINPPHVERLALPAARPVARAWEWLVPVGLVIGLFIAFVVAQGAALWGGHDYVQRTTGLTYAESVHQGFGQLTLVTLLTLVTVALAGRKAPVASGPDRLRARIALGLLCILALVVVASALYRMHVYQEAYGFTVLRLLVDAFEVWMGLLLVLVLLAGVRLSGRWLPRGALLSGAVFVLVIGLANPEAWVAQRNIDRYQSSGKLDVAYLASLGDDAAPTIAAGLPRTVAACVLGSSGARPSQTDGLSWNLGRSRAASLGGDPLPEDDQAACSGMRSEGLPQ